MMNLHPRVRPPGSKKHATKIHGCAYAWALLARVFLAAPWWRWRLLPGLPAMRRGIQIRLDHDAPHRAGGTCQAGDGRRSAQSLPGEAAFVGTAGSPVEARHSLALSGQQNQHLV